MSGGAEVAPSEARITPVSTSSNDRTDISGEVGSPDQDRHRDGPADARAERHGDSDCTPIEAGVDVAQAQANGQLLEGDGPDGAGASTEAELEADAFEAWQAHRAAEAEQTTDPSPQQTLLEI
jgi:hypothetical protein